MRITQRAVALTSLQGLNRNLDAVGQAAAAAHLRAGSSTRRRTRRPAPTGRCRPAASRPRVAQQARNITDAQSWLEQTDSTLQNMLDATPPGPRPHRPGPEHRRGVRRQPAGAGHRGRVAAGGPAHAGQHQRPGPPAVRRRHARAARPTTPPAPTSGSAGAAGHPAGLGHRDAPGRPHRARGVRHRRATTCSPSSTGSPPTSLADPAALEAHLADLDVVMQRHVRRGRRRRRPGRPGRAASRRSTPTGRSPWSRSWPRPRTSTCRTPSCGCRCSRSATRPRWRPRRRRSRRRCMDYLR